MPRSIFKIRSGWLDGFRKADVVGLIGSHWEPNVRVQARAAGGASICQPLFGGRRLNRSATSGWSRPEAVTWLDVRDDRQAGSVRISASEVPKDFSMAACAGTQDAPEGAPRAISRRFTKRLRERIPRRLVDSRVHSASRCHICLVHRSPGSGPQRIRCRCGDSRVHISSRPRKR